MKISPCKIPPRFTVTVISKGRLLLRTKTCLDFPSCSCTKRSWESFSHLNLIETIVCWATGLTPSLPGTFHYFCQDYLCSWSTADLTNAQFSQLQTQLVFLQVGKLRLPFSLGNLCSPYFHWGRCPWQRYKYLIAVTAQSFISLVPGITNHSKRKVVWLSLVFKAQLKMGLRSPKNQSEIYRKELQPNSWISSWVHSSLTGPGMISTLFQCKI